MTTSSTLADQERPAAAAGAKPVRTAADANGDGGAPSRRDLVAMHNSLLKAIQAGQGRGGDSGPDVAIGKLQAKLAEFGDAILRMEGLLAVNLRAEVQKAVRDIAGPEAIMRVALKPRRLSRMLLLSLLLNLLLALGVLALAVPELGYWVEHQVLPRLSEVLELPMLLARGL